MDSILSLLKDNNIAVIICSVIAVVILLPMILLGRKNPLESPYVHKGIPVLGNFIEFAKGPVGFIDSCYRSHGNIFTVPMFHKRLVFLIGPEVSTPFYKLGDDVMSQPEVYGFMKPVFGDGVVYDAEPKKRTQQMQHMATGLRAQRLRAYVPKIEMETIAYLQKWGDSGEINLLDALSELTILTSSRCLHGDDVRENLFAEVSHYYHDLDKGVTPLSFFFPYAPTAAHAKRDAARLKMVEIFSKVIKARRAEGGDTSERTDILQVFMDLKYKDDSVLSDDEIVGLLIALLFAGQHTSSITSTWTLMLLLHNPKCLAEVMLEQMNCLNSQDTLDFDSVGKMEYLQNATKESLRMFPPLIMLMRMAMSDVETTDGDKKYIIPKGSICITSPAVSGRLEQYFKDPELFDPERFSAEREEQKVPYAYLGFGAGMHQCMGQQFGLLQVKTILSILLRNFNFEPVDKEVPEPDYAAMVVGPKNHLQVRYKKLPHAFI